VLANAVQSGLMDAPQLVNNRFGRGEIATIIDRRGACVALDRDSGKPINEEKRISTILKRRI
jgi:hypothetical protein